MTDSPTDQNFPPESDSYLQSEPVDYAPADEPGPPIRIGPAIFISVLGLAAFFGLLFFGGVSLARLFGVFIAPPLTGLLLLVWWLFFSRAGKRRRRIGVLAMFILTGVALALGDPVGRAFIALWGVPATMIVAVFYWYVSSSLEEKQRRIGLIVAVTIGFLPWLFLRTSGQIGEGMLTFAPRWSDPNYEAFTLWHKQNDSPRLAVIELPSSVTSEDWPAFRGPQRDSVVRSGTSLTADTLKNMKELWRHPVGAGWPSFCVVGPLCYTQEQRGDKECVVCYDLDSGKQRWVYVRDNRFEEMSGGPGPRATPTYLDKRLYTYGPEGHLACLDALTGEKIWAVEASPDGVPIWGAACSPLITDDLVIVALYGKGGKLAAYNKINGELVWRAHGGDEGYSSPQLATLGGVMQVLILDGRGFSGNSLEDGHELWFYDWPTNEPKVVQPWPLDDATVLISMGYGRGMRRLKITHDDDNWSVDEVWASNKIKTKFNDFICKDGYAYGLDEGIMTCVSLEDGSRQWKGGRYGYGQILLVGDKFLVVSEEGNLVLVEATPEEHNELINVPAVEGKTWNHPVIARGKLLVRNGAEAVCYDIR